MLNKYNFIVVLNTVSTKSSARNKKKKKNNDWVNAAEY